MNILIWSPFLQKVGTTSNVYNLINATTKYSTQELNSIDLINVFGEWDDYEFVNKKVKKISFFNFYFLKKIKKNGFLRSRIFTFLIIILSLFPLIKLLKKKNYDFFFIHLITFLPIFLAKFFKNKIKLILHISGFPKLTYLRSYFWKRNQKIFKDFISSKKLGHLISKLIKLKAIGTYNLSIGKKIYLDDIIRWLNFYNPNSFKIINQDKLNFNKDSFYLNNNKILKKTKIKMTISDLKKDCKKISKIYFLENKK